MKRRVFLAGVATGLAGCVRTPRSTSDRTERATPTVPSDISLPVPEGDLRQAVPRDAIPAITEPVFAADWSDVVIDTGDGVYEPRLADDDRVVGVERDGTARAYPVSVLSWHEVVNDDFGGSLLVTYCPLCRSAVVADRFVNGEPAVFGVSGALWHENLVLYDAVDDNLWSQVLARAIRGPDTGDALSLVPATVTTWKAWRDRHPGTEVLLPAPISNTVRGRVQFNYGLDLYEQWDKVWNAYPDEAPGDVGGDTRVPKRELVMGIRDGDVATAYPLNRVQWVGAANDVVGSVPVVVAIGDGHSLVAYDRRLGGDTYSFEWRDGALVADGSRFDVDAGVAVDGPLEGERLERANRHSPMYWFAWLAFNPETTVWSP